MVRSFGWLALGLAAAVALSACREGEQDRFRMYKAGVYQGKPDQGLSEAQRDALIVRMNEQAGAQLGTSRIDKMPGDVRPPR